MVATSGSRQGLIGIGAMVVLVAASAALLAQLGAPSRTLLANAVGLVCALAAYGLARLVLPRAHAALVAGLLLALMLATALWGFALEDVRRWVRLGPFTVHAGYILVPLLLAASMRLGLWYPAMLLALGAVLWLQPDAGVATGVAISAAAAALAVRSRATLAGAVIATAWAAATWLRPDPLAPAQFVEHVPELAWSQHPALGAAAFVLLAAPALPFLILGTTDTARRPVFWAIGGFWAGAAAASLAGHFPNPILGAGIGPIIGYALSWAACAAPFRDARRASTNASS